MPEIRFSVLALTELQTFIRMYEEGFLVLYRESGLLDEDLILENYKQAALNLNRKIFTEIEARLRDEKVLGRKNLADWQELSFYIGARLVTVYFSEDLKNQIRLVERIWIDRKPIIF